MAHMKVLLPTLSVKDCPEIVPIIARSQLIEENDGAHLYTINS